MIPAPLIRCRPGDVIVVRTSGWAERLIRLGAAIRDEPNLDDHVAVIHHTTDGIVWGIEGRPGGAGWVDVGRYFTGPFAKYTVTNWHQPKTTRQRNSICKIIEALPGRNKYDWIAIAEDAALTIGINYKDLPQIMQSWWREAGSRGHLVCSSLAEYAYAKAGLDAPPHPDSDIRNITPADWEQWILQKGYDV